MLKWPSDAWDAERYIRGIEFSEKYSKYIPKKVPVIKNVIFNEPLTIVIWMDGTKTIVKCAEDEFYDKEKGLAMAISKKALGNRYKDTNVIKNWIAKTEERDKKKKEKAKKTKSKAKRNRRAYKK